MWVIIIIIGKKSRCGHCTNCKLPNCGTCRNCIDMPRFGGEGRKKQGCIKRKCLHVVNKSPCAIGTYNNIVYGNTYIHFYE